MSYGSSKSFSSVSESRGSTSMSSSGGSGSVDSGSPGGSGSGGSGGGGGGDLSSSSGSGSSSDSCSSCSSGTCSFTVQSILLDEFSAEITFTNTGDQTLLIYDLSHSAGGSISPGSYEIAPGMSGTFSLTSAGDVRLTEVYYFNSCYAGQGTVIIPET